MRRAALAPRPPSIERVEAAQFPVITVPMRFSGATMARTPARADLALSEDGQPVADFELTVDPEPLVISLVVDQSGIMIPATDARLPSS